MTSKTAIHALSALTALARLPEGSYAGAASIARAIGAPQNYLGKLLQILARAGIVRSQKGLGGGFRLARRPEEISLFDAVEPIEHVSRWNGCFMGRSRCSDHEPCAVHRRWSRVRNAYLEFLSSTTIADLVSRPAKGKKQ